jgi:hypothetical protein
MRSTKHSLLTIFIVLFLLHGFKSISQTAVDSVLKQRYEAETIYMDGNNSCYYKNNKLHKRGLFNRKLRKEFDSCSVESKQEIANCIHNQKTGSGCSVSSGIIFFGSFVALPFVAAPLAAGIAVVAFVPYTIGVIKLYKANRQFNKAIWLHNRDVVLKNK